MNDGLTMTWKPNATLLRKTVRRFFKGWKNVCDTPSRRYGRSEDSGSSSRY